MMHIEGLADELDACVNLKNLGDHMKHTKIIMSTLKSLWSTLKMKFFKNLIKKHTKNRKEVDSKCAPTQSVPDLNARTLMKQVSE